MSDDEFLWLGNHPGPDLCNTEPVLAGSRVDLLVDLASLARWTGAVGVVAPEARRSSRASEEVLGWVRRLRSALREVLDPATRSESARWALNDVLAEHAGILEVREVAGGFDVALSSSDELERFRLELASTVLDVFRYDLSLVRRCANPDCVLLFLDVSRSRRRRWCDMSTCGNRAKVAAHYDRHRPS